MKYLFVICFSVFILKTQAQAKWNCGEKEKSTVVATFDGANQTLVIAGTGKMCDDCRPWGNLKDAIKTVKVNSGVTTIPSKAFGSLYEDEHYNNLESVIIPNSVTRIGDAAFWGAVKLRKINIPNGVTIIGNSAFRMSGLEGSITLPRSIKSLGLQVFNSTSLKTVDLGKTQISSLDNGSFAYCKLLEDVYLPQTLESICYDVFTECDSLKSITCYSLTPPNFEAGLSNGDSEEPLRVLLKKITLYVPEASILVYKYSDFWKESGKIEAIPAPSPKK